MSGMLCVNIGWILTLYICVLQETTMLTMLKNRKLRNKYWHLQAVLTFLCKPGDARDEELPYRYTSQFI